jgi:hypothetical protein
MPKGMAYKEQLLSMLEALGSILRTEKKEKKIWQIMEP